MYLGLLCERRAEFPFAAADPRDLDSELLSEQEEDELVSGFRDAGHEVVVIRGVKALLARVWFWRKRCQLVFNRSSGFHGSERTLLAPAVLEAAGIPYVGSTPYVQTLVRNKLHTKLVAEHAKVHTPPAAILVPGVRQPDLAGIEFPAIVKLLAESSSVGLNRSTSIVRDANEATSRARELAHRYSQPVLIETFIRGHEIEVPVLIDDRVRVPGMLAVAKNGTLVSGEDFLDGSSVYHDDYNFVTPPASLDIDRVGDAAVRTAIALGMRDYGRVDFRIDDNGTPWMIEADTIPHLQRLSSFYEVAKNRGLEYHEMLAEIIAPAAARALR